MSTTAPSRVRAVVRGVLLALWALVAAGSVAYLAGLIFGVGHRWGLYAAALALPGAALALLTAGAVATGLFAWAAGARARAFVVAAGALALVLVVALAIHAVNVPPTTRVADLPAASASGDAGDGIRVVAWNLRHGDVDAATRAAFVANTAADIAVFPELTTDQVLADGAPEGYQVLGEPGIGVIVLVSDRLGAYQVVAAAPTGGTGLVVEPVDADSTAPRIVAVHVMRIALSWGSEMWNEGLDWVAAQCEADNTIALGDFNAAPINMPDGRLGSCTRAGDAVPSWPTSVPPVWGATIDHILTTPNWTATATATLDVPGASTDHRPVFAELARTP